MTPREIYKKALIDPRLEIELIAPAHYAELAKLLEKLPPTADISEWSHMHGAGYEYHYHINGVGSQLRKLIGDEKRGGNPKLVKIYSRRELETIIQENQTDPE